MRDVGVENWSIESLRTYFVRSFDEQRKKEKIHIQLLTPDLNSITSFRTYEERLAQFANYNNSEKGKARMARHKARVVAECELCSYTTHAMCLYRKHLNTRRHLAKVAELEEQGIGSD